MSKTWGMVVIAAFFEVSWVVGLKHASSVLEWGGTCIAIAISFYLMIMAARDVAVGTIYAVFVGLGTAGTVLVDMVVFGATVVGSKLVLLALVLSGVISLKLLSEPNGKIRR